MQINSSQTEGNIVLIALEGDIDYQASNSLREELKKIIEKQPPKILIDFEKVAYIDSSGIAAFVELSQHVRPFGGKIAFFSLNDSVEKVFELARLNLFFPIAKSKDEAIALIGS